MSLEVKELRPGVAAGAVDVVLADEHGNERLVRVSDDGVVELAEGMLVPVSDEVEAMARAAVAARPQLGGDTDAGTDPDHLSASAVTGAFAAIPDSARISRPHVGTGEVDLAGCVDSTQRVLHDDRAGSGEDD